MPDPAKSSRRLAAQRRIAWRTGASAQSAEETRAYFQTRLALFCKLVFWSFVALMVFLFVMYERYPRIQPGYQKLIYGVAVIALTLLAFIWRVLLVRSKPSIDVLYLLDLIIVIGSGVTFGTVAALAYDLQASSYTCLLYQSFVVFTRAIVVPSSAKRTAIASTLAFVPIVAGSAVLAGMDAPEIPGVAFVAGDILYNGVAVALATTGSRIIYGLRKQVSEVMQFGQYTLGRKIGAGGMGAVYEAHHALLRRPTAIKLLQPSLVGVENLDRFEREVQAMSQLTHPNTVAVFDYGHSDGVLYYAMEYLDGINLEELVRIHGPQPAARVVDVLVQVCGALQEAHDAGLIHRDVKPHNIILCERGGMPDVAKVVDFGLVKEITRDAGKSAQVIMGTPHYLAPEAVIDSENVTTSVDLYALGAVGYYLLTGQRLFTGKTQLDVCIQHVTTQPKRPSELSSALHIPPELDAVIMKCLSKRPEDRYATARELSEALEATPRPPTWDREEARRWWREFRVHRAEQKPVTSDAETMTITIDLEPRG